jgi:hypothetical protein
MMIQFIELTETSFPENLRFQIIASDLFSTSNTAFTGERKRGKEEQIGGWYLLDNPADLPFDPRKNSGMRLRAKVAMSNRANKPFVRENLPMEFPYKVQ